MGYLVNDLCKVFAGILLKGLLGMYRLMLILEFRGVKQMRIAWKDFGKKNGT